MHRQQLFFLLSISIFIFMVPFTAQAEERVLILFEETTDTELVEEVDGEVNREIEAIPAVTATVPEDAIAELERNPAVLAVEEDVRVSATGQVVDWGFSRIQAQRAQASGLTGKGVKIAIIDSGIAAHEDLHISGGISFVSYTKNYQDDNGHGTFVAGVIGAADNGIGTVGAAPEAELYAVKVLDQHGLGYLSDVIEGIDWSIERKMDIINLSLSTDADSLLLKQIVDKAYADDILVVASGGNNGGDVSVDNVNYPARYASVIAVGATDAADLRARFSVTGPSMEITAPGVEVESTILSDQYGYMSGTSMAAPFVSANLALLKQLYGPIDGRKLRSYLQENVLDLGVPGRDPLYGFGLAQTPVFQQAAAVDPTDYTRSGITLDDPTIIYHQDGSQLKMIAQGTRIHYKLFSDTAYEVLVPGGVGYQIGYMNKNDLEPITSRPAAKRGIALKSGTPLYARASTDSKVLKTVSAGSILYYRTFTSEWYEITATVNGERIPGYLAKSAVENAFSRPASIKGVALNHTTSIYQKASTRSKALKTVPAGTILHYKGFTSKWYEVTVTINGKRLNGYLPKTSVENAAAKSVALTGTAIANPTKIYAKPDQDAKVIKRYSKGSFLRYRSFTKNWHQAITYINKKPVTVYIKAADVRTKR